MTVLNPGASGDTSLLYSTFLGGNDTDKGTAIVLDSANNAHIAGYTKSTNFPTLTPLQANRSGDYDAFVAKLNPAVAGSGSLLYSSYLGGTAEDRALGIWVDSQARPVVTGWTRSSNYPTHEALQGSLGGGTCETLPCADAFVTQPAI